MGAGKQSSSSFWSWEENKKFEVALVAYTENHPIPIPWDKLAAELPGRTVAEVKAHYDELVEDICKIDSFVLSLPDCDVPEESAAGCSDANRGSVDEPRRDQEEIKSAGEGNPRQRKNTSNTHRTLSA
ncbi:Myb-like DNA-binding domain [Musa troglodytarum]|uniref:Myb-like DNA-binding domain n=1 Tax=Musa troglodytarum TaxID=320322 RepID=A0A9E7FPL6_9LILI|nr:Myb-like DNA-binding domain [Musa troglodytarum]